MALSNYTVRCVKTMSSDELKDRVAAIMAESLTSDERADLHLVSANAMAWGF